MNDDRMPDNNAALLELEKYMWQYEQGHTLRQFNLPEPTACASESANRTLSEVLLLNSASLDAYVEQHMLLLNDDQRAAFQAVTGALGTAQVGPYSLPPSCPPGLHDIHLRPLQGGIFFLDGPGGTGKTFVYKLLLAHVRSMQAALPLDQQRVALAVASSALAATLLPGGTTAHSRFKIPIPANKDSTCR